MLSTTVHAFYSGCLAQFLAVKEWLLCHAVLYATIVSNAFPLSEKKKGLDYSHRKSD